MEYLRDDQNLKGAEEAPREISAKADSEIEEQIRSCDSAAVKLDTPEAWCDNHQKGETNETKNSTLDWLKFTGRNFLTVCNYQLNFN